MEKNSKMLILYTVFMFNDPPLWELLLIPKDMLRITGFLQKFFLCGDSLAVPLPQDLPYPACLGLGCAEGVSGGLCHLGALELVDDHLGIAPVPFAEGLGYRQEVAVDDVYV